MEKIIERTAQTREATVAHTARPKVWAPPERLGEMLESFSLLLPDFHLRWVRRELRGDHQDANVLRRIREGYEPVRPSEIGVTDLRTAEDGRFAGTVIAGDLMLMKQPKEMTEQRKTYYNDRTRAQQRATDSKLDAEQNTTMPITRNISVHTTTGRPKQIKVDE